MTNVKKFFAVVTTMTFVSLAGLLWNCTDDNQDDDTTFIHDTTFINDTAVIRILSPTEGSTFNNYDNIIVITKFDPTKVGVDLRRKFSIDSCKTFNEMSYDKIEGRIKESSGVEYSYEVIRWKLSEDSVKNVQAYIRIASYGDENVYDLIGPLQID